jgi:TPR repeat protein
MLKKIIVITSLAVISFPILAGYEEGYQAYKDKNYVRALSELLPAADLGDDKAMDLLGDIYFEGLGGKKDQQLALNFYIKAAEKGNIDSQHSLGWVYSYAEDKSLRDNTKSAAWFRKAADQGSLQSQVELGLMYEVGRGVLKNEKLAVEWYRKAAAKGNSRAQNNLGNMYFWGKGTNKDIDEAVVWYRKAAEQGVADAMNSMGVRYEKGEGVEKKLATAVYWYSQSINSGEKEYSLKNLRRLWDEAEKAEIKNNKTPLYREASGDVASFFLEKGKIIALFSDPLHGRSFAFFDNKEDKYGWVNVQAIETQTQKNNRLAAAFRSTIKVGIETNCGPALEIRGELVKIYSPVKDYGNEHWIRRDQLYPSGSGCSFQNGRYIGR